MSTDEILDLLQTIPCGYKSSSDEFFTPANTILIPVYKKLGVITSAEGPPNSDLSELQNLSNNSLNEIFCNVPSCRRYFDSVVSYQQHFNSVHRYICSECNKSLPTPHLLDLHISEKHDSYFAARLARGEPMYECFLEECNTKLRTPAERKEHCISLHQFPSNFRFDQVRRGGASRDIEAMDTNQSDQPKLKKQTSFAFGHQKSKTFISKNQKKNGRNNTLDGETLENLQGLKDALEGMS